MTSRDLKERSLSSRLDDTNYEYFWGCELSKDKTSVTWSFEEEEGDTDFLTHTLFLKHAVLGAGAVKDERNLVQVETKNFDGDDVKQPMFSLTLGKTDSCFLDVSFGHLIPVTFRLIEGTGPVCVTAQQLVEFPVESGLGDDSQDDLMEEIATEDEEESPLKPAKKRKAVAQKPTKSKKGKLDSNAENGSEEESMDEEDDDDDLEGEDEVDDEEDVEDEEDEEEDDSPPKIRGKIKGKKVVKGKAAPNGNKASSKAVKKPVKAANGKASAKKGGRKVKS